MLKTASPKLHLFLALITVGLSSCEKTELLEFGNPPKRISSPDQMLCPDGSVKGPTTKLLWQDEFNGAADPTEKDPPSCFSEEMRTCSQRVDWFHEGPCTTPIKDPSQLADLNKCRWTIWDGGTASKNITTDPNQVEVSGGTVKIKVHVRPDSEGPFLCNESNRDSLAGDYYNTNCKIQVGGIDTRSRVETPKRGERNGRVFTEGRMEIRARMNIKSGMWPALWTWRNDREEDKLTVGEIDILEVFSKGGNSSAAAMQTYHNWGPTPGFHEGSGGKDTLLKDATKWVTYGMERRGEELRFYVDGCYTRSFINGKTKGQNGKTMFVDPSEDQFLIMSMGIMNEVKGNPSLNMNEGNLEVDWVRFYE